MGLVIGQNASMEVSSSSVSTPVLASQSASPSSAPVHSAVASTSHPSLEVTTPDIKATDDSPSSASSVTSGVQCKRSTVDAVDVRVYESSIANHLVSDCECRDSYSDACFSILSRARSVRYLKVLESIYIFTTKPSLCKQKKNLFVLKLFVNLAR